MTIHSFLIASAVVISLVPVAVSAQVNHSSASAVETSAPSIQDLSLRLRELERQVDALRRQLAIAQRTDSSTESSEAAAALSTTGTLEERFDALDQRLRVLAREEELRREAQAEQVRAAPAMTAGREGFQLRSADGAFSLRLRGLIHADSRVYLEDSAETGVDSFVLRRVRPIVEATMFKNFDLRLTPDFGNGQTVLQDAYIDMRFSTAFRIRAGKQKQPFGLERLVSASELLFVERALPTGVAGNRDVGVMASGDLVSGHVSYSAGAFNGVVDGGSADADDRDGKELVARVFTQPFRSARNERLQGLGLGAALSYGVHRGSIAAPGVASYRTAGQQTFFRYLSDSSGPGTVVANGDRRRLSAQGYYYAGQFGLLGEYVTSRQDLRRGPQTIAARTSSWQVASSWVLTGERAGYRGVVPRNVFERANGTWGAFELGARYNQLAVADEVFPVFANANVSARVARGGAVGLNWYLNRNVKVTFDYEQTHFTGGAVNGNRRTERDFLSRVQFSF